MRKRVVNGCVCGPNDQLRSLAKKKKNKIEKSEEGAKDEKKNGE